MIPVASSNDSNGCVSTSSNCVIWQGPDIACIDLCHGDSISEVVYKLATELCDVLDQTNLQKLDLSCLELNPSEQPADLNEFFQLIVDELCSLSGRCSALEGGSTGGSTPSTTTVNFASCLQYDDPATGDPVTSGTVEEYAVLIGNKVCQLVSNISTINTTLSQHNTRITALENANNTTVIPTVTPTCVLPAVPQQLELVVEAIEEQFCELRAATGTASELISATADQCANLSSADRLSGSGTMATMPGWNTQVTNLSHAISNMWLTICDMRAAINSVMDCCAADCTDIILAMIATIDSAGTTISVNFNGSSIPSSFIPCNPLGSLVTVTDSAGNTYTERVNVGSYASQSTVLSITLSGTTLTPGSNYTVALDHCVTDGNTTCEKRLTSEIVNGTGCPTLETTITDTQIDYSFLHTLGTSVSYTIQLLDANDNLLSAKTHINQANGTLSGTFLGLTAGTVYKLKAIVQISGQADKVCPALQVTTTGDAGAGESCAIPTGITVTVNV